MVKLPRAEPGDKRNIIMWAEREGKRGGRLEDWNNEKMSGTIEMGKYYLDTKLRLRGTGGEEPE
jgi:hypothetical protein